MCSAHPCDRHIIPRPTARINEHPAAARHGAAHEMSGNPNSLAGSKPKLKGLNANPRASGAEKEGRRPNSSSSGNRLPESDATGDQKRLGMATAFPAKRRELAMPSRAQGRHSVRVAQSPAPGI